MTAAAKGSLLGYWPACPLCGEPKMEVKTDRKGNPYLWCKANPHCNVQIFSLGKGDRAKNMLAKMTAPDAPAADQAPAPTPTPTPSSAPKSGGAFRTLLNLGE